MTNPKSIELIDQYVRDNQDIIEPLMAKARDYVASGDGDSLLLLSAVMVGLGNAIKEIVAQTAVFTQGDQGGAKH